MNSKKRKLLVHAPSITELECIVSGKKINTFTDKCFVLLHFFTGGCINCLHVLEELKRVEFPKGLVVIGIHTGKFDKEKEDEWIKELIARYNIDHPVINDADGRLWDSYGVRAWPTLVLVSPDGYEVARSSGEGRVPKLLEAFEKYRNDYTLSGEWSILNMNSKRVSSDFSKLFATKENIFLSDIGRGCVHICTHTGEIIKTIEGFKEPQGIYVKDDYIYVADRLAGTVVKVDLQNGNRRVIADNLRSPWGLTGDEQRLQIAVAGSHQIWQVDYDGNNLTLLAGIGSEGIRDGDAVTEALFAQPTDLDWLNDTLYVIDAEGSALRSIEYGRVKTLIGWDLFTFGDCDGIAELVRLQHPEGLCAGIGGCGNQRIFICDTYNGKVKVYDPLNGRVVTLIDGLNHPTGICKVDCWLYVVERGEDILGRFDISTMEYERMKIE
ncbi:thioredoxin-like domain-containing protein [Hydrogenimonas thermophila]|uniref:DNA-binding beta-propeller fold protein YncE n=1 Tax=Hydrogenimonas thermophila TaxID=223786 RepID=A0A1I5MBC5_9BACT|nr:thioredoxin-like domain-containing protein [Hydrogenimonas thermophila]WOE70632.1 thioredoxin-like domain-containing protein [Hydrogenimonas thermophila]WOE73150.1 thioredoxin-like domain-containing protein [Hydrogenimonas thermophila]SFP06809.1 DNA-binding beta-propeller fold protein YncE [Hydrogenimonas thermophila]